MNIIESVRASWEVGRPILLFDSEDREGEVDMMLPSEVMTPGVIAQMREDAGGLICCAVSSEVAELAGLPFMVDVLNEAGNKFPILKQMLEHGLPYGARSSFSLTVNHVDSFTGITDIDRSMTIRGIGELVREELTPSLAEEFGSTLRIPGHVPLLRGADGLLRSRLGHTELGLALCELTGFSPSVTMCEMMDSETGKALSVADAKRYAEEHGLVYLSGRQVIQLWTRTNGIKESEIFQR